MSEEKKNELQLYFVFQIASHLETYILPALTQKPIFNKY